MKGLSVLTSELEILQIQRSAIGEFEPFAGASVDSSTGRYKVGEAKRTYYRLRFAKGGSVTITEAQAEEYRDRIRKTKLAKKLDKQISELQCKIRRLR